MNITKPTKIEQGISIYEASDWPITGDLFNSGLIDLGNWIWAKFTLNSVTQPDLVDGYAEIFVSPTQPDDDQNELALVSINNINPAYVSSETLSFSGHGITISISPNPNTQKYNIDITSSLIKGNNQDHTLTHRIETNVSIKPIYKMQPDVVYPTLNEKLMDDTTVLDPTGTDGEYTVYDLSKFPEPLPVESGLLGVPRVVLGLINYTLGGAALLTLKLIGEYRSGKWSVGLLFDPDANLPAQPRSQVNPAENNVAMVGVPQSNQQDYFAKIFSVKNAAKFAAISLTLGTGLFIVGTGAPVIQKVLSKTKIIIPAWLGFQELYKSNQNNQD